MNGISLGEYLELRGVDLRKTYLHVVREPNASRDWRWATEQDCPLTEALQDATRFDTCHNNAATWTSAETIAVLLDTNVKFSTLDYVRNSYLFMGVLQKLRRRPGVPAQKLP